MRRARRQVQPSDGQYASGGSAALSLIRRRVQPAMFW
jgi:hypothetical protein